MVGLTVKKVENRTNNKPKMNQDRLFGNNKKKFLRLINLRQVVVIN